MLWAGLGLPQFLKRPASGASRAVAKSLYSLYSLLIPSKGPSGP